MPSEHQYPQPPGPSGHQTYGYPSPAQSPSSHGTPPPAPASPAHPAYGQAARPPQAYGTYAGYGASGNTSTGGPLGSALNMVGNLAGKNAQNQLQNLASCESLPHPWSVVAR